MKSFKLASLATLALASLANAHGDTTSTPDAFQSARPDAHAPIGVMGDHTHKTGEWMVSYRYMFMAMDGHRAGTNSLSTQQVYDRGFDSAATEMDMEMHMLGLMYAPSDKLTLMAMLNYVTKDMDMEANPMAGGHGGHGTMHAGSHSHSSEGIGDVSIGALYNLYSDDFQRLHLNLGLVLPTADVDEKQDGTYLPYGMQLGSGTYDLQFGLTYQQLYEKFSWGSQAIARIALEEDNESGFAYGDSINVTTWIAAPVTDWLSVSARLNYNFQEDIQGHYNGAHNHSAPPHFQENYGGHVLQAGLGLNIIIPQGPLAGHRFAVEALTPIYQDNNGVGMDRDYTVTLGWQKAF